MTTLKCKVPGCDSVLNLATEAVSSDATYQCRKHAPAATEPHFQECQFDKDLKRAGRPIGTSHIHRQGYPQDSEQEKEEWAKIQEVNKTK